jgi:hypothetical protein
LRIAFDWIDVRNFHPRMAAAVRKGHARPLLGTTYTQGKFTTSPNHREEGRLRLVRTLLPDPVPVILWADRGFGRTERARTGQQLGLRSAIRLQPDG